MVHRRHYHHYHRLKIEAGSDRIQRVDTAAGVRSGESAG